MGSSHHPTKPKMEREDRERSAISLGFRVVVQQKKQDLGWGFHRNFCSCLD
jgi:hypothetical protein